MKRTIAILLAFVMLLFALVSCKKKANASTNTVSPTQFAENDRLSELGSRDFEGKSFRILDANDYPEMHVNYATDETKSDSRISEELYNRDLWLMANYNLDMEYYSKTKAVEGMEAIRVQTAAGKVDYDMVISTAVGPTAEGAGGGTLASLALQEMLRNLNEIKYLSLDKEWWSPLIYKNMLLNDKLFFTTGDIAPSLYQAPAAMYVNMDLFLQYYQDVDLFQIAEDGEWTFEKLFTLTAGLSRDNGDGVMNASDPEDFFGLVLAKNGLAVQNFVIGAGETFSKVENNALTMNLKSETLGAVIEKIGKLYPTMSFDYGGSGSPSEKQQHIINVTFKGGKAVFLAQQLEAAMFHLRDMQGDYAVLPYPKVNADQGQYLSLVNNWCDCFVAVPSAVADDRMEFVGFMMEAMAAYSNKELRPLIYETVLKIQRVNDAQSSAMIDVIMDGIVIDYAIIYDIAGLQEMAKKSAATEEKTPMNVQAMTKKNVINSAIEEIMKAHGIES